MYSAVLMAFISVFGVAVLSVSLFSLGSTARRVSPAPFAEQKKTYGLYIEELDRGLDAVIKSSLALHAESRHSLTFDANLVFAHGALIKRFPLNTLLSYADALKEAGAGRIEIYPSPATWADGDKETIAKYDALISHIRKIGLSVVISPEFNYGERRIRQLSDWQKYAVPAYREMARRYRPEIFVVVHEPTTMADRMEISTTPAEWRGFVEEAVKAVKEASPETKTAAGGQYYELSYYNEFLEVEGLKIMTLGIYRVGNLETYNSMIRIAMSRGREIYIEETWRFPPQEPEEAALPTNLPTPAKGTAPESITPSMHKETCPASKGIGLRDFEAVDGRWLKALTLYANAWGLEGITPFWTTTFFTYVERDGDGLSDEYNSRVQEAIRRQGRTDTFRVFQALSRRYGKRAGSNPGDPCETLEAPGRPLPEKPAVQCFLQSENNTATPRFFLIYSIFSQMLKNIRIKNDNFIFQTGVL